jgi:hypothetical protein
MDVKPVRRVLLIWQRLDAWHLLSRSLESGSGLQA